MLQYQPLIVRSNALLDSSREIVQGYGVSFINWLCLISIIISQSLCYFLAQTNQTGPYLCPRDARLMMRVHAGARKSPHACEYNGRLAKRLKAHRIATTSLVSEFTALLQRHTNRLTWELHLWSAWAQLKAFWRHFNMLSCWYVKSFSLEMSFARCRISVHKCRVSVQKVLNPEKCWLGDKIINRLSTKV
jgi:hypothetical protein